MRRDFLRRGDRGHAHDEFGRGEATRRLRIEPADEPSRRVRRERRDDAGDVLVRERTEHEQVAAARRMRFEPARQHRRGLRIVRDIDDQFGFARRGKTLQPRRDARAADTLGESVRGDRDPTAQGAQCGDRGRGIRALDGGRQRGLRQLEAFFAVAFFAEIERPPGNRRCGNGIGDAIVATCDYRVRASLFGRFEQRGRCVLVADDRGLDLRKMPAFSRAIASRLSPSQSM